MKQFYICGEVSYTYYFTVEANSAKEAKEKAHQKLQGNYTQMQREISRLEISAVSTKPMQ